MAEAASSGSTSGAILAALDSEDPKTHYGAAMCPVTNYGEVSEALRSKALSADCGGPGDEYCRGGTILRLDGAAHRRRRQAIGELVHRGGHEWFRSNVLVPTVRDEIEALLGAPADEDGARRVDLRRWIHLINTQLASAFVGLDRGRSMEGAAELLALNKRYIEGFPNGYVQVVNGFDENGAIERDALRAAAEFTELYYAPARAKREALVRQVAAGELDEGALPKDLITQFIKLTDPAWADPDLCVRESLFMIAAIVVTTAETTLTALGDLFAWFDEHPEDWGLRFETAFLEHAIEETLRIHPFQPALPRRAIADVELQDGTHIRAGDVAMIVYGPGNLDPAMFGLDAREFDPHRSYPKGVPPYGNAFGAGPHMCLGLPLAMGQKGIDGNVIVLLRALFEAGIARDPGNPAPPIHAGRGVPKTVEEIIVPYPMMFPVAATDLATG